MAEQATAKQDEFINKLLKRIDRPVTVAAPRRERSVRSGRHEQGRRVRALLLVSSSDAAMTSRPRRCWEPCAGGWWPSRSA